MSNIHNFHNVVSTRYFLVGVLRAAKTDLEDAIVRKVSAEAGNAHALLQDVNVILMFAGIAGSGNLSLHFSVRCFSVYYVTGTIKQLPIII